MSIYLSVIKQVHTGVSVLLCYEFDPMSYKAESTNSILISPNTVSDIPARRSLCSQNKPPCKSASLYNSNILVK